MQTESVNDKLARLQTVYELLGAEIGLLKAEIERQRERSELTEGLLTTEEVATLLKIDTSTVQRWAVAGRIKAYRIGGLWRFPKAIVQIITAQIEQDKEKATIQGKLHDGRVRRSRQ